MALWDLAGKAYNAPVYQMIGGKFRDRIRCYADTTEDHDPQVYGKRLTLNVSLPIAAVLLDFGWAPEIVKAVPILARPASLLAHLAEERGV